MLSETNNCSPPINEAQARPLECLCLTHSSYVGPNEKRGSISRTRARGPCRGRRRESRQRSRHRGRAPKQKMPFQLPREAVAESYQSIKREPARKDLVTGKDLIALGRKLGLAGQVCSQFSDWEQGGTIWGLNPLQASLHP